MITLQRHRFRLTGMTPESRSVRIFMCLDCAVGLGAIQTHNQRFSSSSDHATPPPGTGLAPPCVIGLPAGPMLGGVPVVTGAPPVAPG